MSCLFVNMVYDINNLTIARLVSLQHDESFTTQQICQFSYLYKNVCIGESSPVPNAKNPGSWHARGGGRCFYKKSIFRIILVDADLKCKVLEI